MYQERPYLERNWDLFPFPPGEVDALLLTHAHMDHSGLIPKLVKEGFSGRIIATAASAELLPIVLMDAARLQEEDAAFKKKRHQKEGRKGAHPEVPLYTEADVEKALPLVETIAYGKTLSLEPSLSVVFHDAGHILGSAMIEMLAGEAGKTARLIFSGDVGQWNKPLVRDPSVFEAADVVVMESTYGDRDHRDPIDPQALLAKIINETVEAGGNVVIPTFALERAQELIYHLGRLVRTKRIPQLMTFLDSPMATEVTEVFEHHPEFLDEEAFALFKSGQNPFRFPGLKLIHSIEESKAINRIKGSCIILAGSGMCTGGRIKHHLVQNISRPESTILFVGYQARGTLGRQILDHAAEVRIFGRNLSVKAHVEEIQGFSAHAGQSGLLEWLGHFRLRPSYLFLTHGDKDVSHGLADRLAKEGWNVHVPDYGEEWEIKLV
jgi:metallo-beta-lactamase family protein